MYFDHVRCPSCGAQFDPEAIDGSGGFAACPACKGQLDVKSLFGVAAHLEEADAPKAGIDDLVAGYGQSADPWRQTSALDPLADNQQQQQQRARPSQPRQAARPSQRQAPRGGTSMVRGGESDDEGGSSSVLRALREIKKRR